VRSVLLLTLVPTMALADPALTALAQRKVFFAHQSVGENVLSGLAALAREANVSLRVVETTAADALATPGIAHAKVGKNEDPHSKLAHFEALLDGPGAAAEVAVLKLCYVDFNAGTDPKALFDAYLSRVAAVKKKRPDLALVHVTAPLTTVQTGIKGTLKNLLGRAAAGERENQARERYNALLRAEFAGKEPLWDLAAVEAGQGAGACSFTRDGKAWPCLKPELTDDGGHLNARGQREAAGALVQALAAAKR
jgi:hypothetical protein